MPHTLRLSQILARQVGVDWFEAVAVFRALTEQPLQTARTWVIPELEHIALDIDGRLTLLGGTPTDEPVRELGKLLHELLEQSTPHVQLRLLIAQATAETPAFGSIEEFSTAVAYFERPNREEVLTALYSRAAAAAPPDAFAELPAEEDWAASFSSETPPTLVSKTWGDRRRRTMLFAAAGILLVLVAVGAYLLAGGASQVSSLAAKATDAVGSAVVSGVTSAKPEQPAPAQPVESASAAPAAGPAPTQPRKPSPTPTSKAVSQKPAPPATSAKAQGGGTVTPPKRVEILPIPVLKETATTGKPVAPPPAAAPGTAVAPPPNPATPASPPIQKPPPEPAVYSQENPDVTPPVAISPQLPREIPASIDRTKLVHIELIVLPNGNVGSVRLLNNPYNVHESMFLSAAKSWKFRPAMKDGKPVTYMKVITIGYTRR